MTDNSPAILLRQVTLSHGARVLLDRADLSLASGTFTVLAGANGHGKTTLMRALLGLHPVHEGEIRTLGRKPSAARRWIGYMPQERRIPAPQLTGKALISASWRGTSLGLPGWGQGAKTALKAALTLTGAEALAAQPLNQLSGGERQRLFLAEALLDNPALLILDEPLSGMDMDWQRRILAMLRARCRETGMAVLMSCHGLEEVSRFADHLLQISQRKLELSDVAL
ncbi:metal ABC transporter ATP-binding protein [Asaia prunellae]|uniref:metal ABC transporter ATP-binding protein n=1 Tax=Asaia prunellae TaxID=610245 RepID=UPI00046F5F37|nr:ATP-binding cassette domain-containing protein [Asaia prunellae]